MKRTIAALSLGLLGNAIATAAEWRYFGGDKAFTRYSPLLRDSVSV